MDFSTKLFVIVLVIAKFKLYCSHALVSENAIKIKSYNTQLPITINDLNNKKENI